MSAFPTHQPGLIGWPPLRWFHGRPIRYWGDAGQAANRADTGQALGVDRRVLGGEERIRSMFKINLAGFRLRVFTADGT